MSAAMDMMSPTEMGQHGNEWRGKWPKHCRSCGGWGGKNHVQSQPYGSATAGESLLDPCAATTDARICHRCGKEGLTVDGDGPCQHCGWDFDDGDPDRS